MKLTITNPKTTEEFGAMLASVGLPLPWDLRGDGCLYAANGNCASSCDPDSDLPDIAALKGAMLIQLAVNTCGGFKAFVEPETAARG